MESGVFPYIRQLTPHFAPFCLAPVLFQTFSFLFFFFLDFSTSRFYYPPLNLSLLTESAFRSFNLLTFPWPIFTTLHQTTYYSHSFAFLPVPNNILPPSLFYPPVLTPPLSLLPSRLLHSRSVGRVLGCSTQPAFSGAVFCVYAHVCVPSLLPRSFRSLSWQTFRLLPFRIFVIFFFFQNIFF